MRVVHFCRWFSPLEETFIYDRITDLEQLGLDNRVVTLERQNEQSRPFAKVDVLSRPGRFHPLGFADRVYNRIRSTPRREESWVGFDSTLARLLRQHQPNIVHAHFGREASLVAPVARRLSLPLVVSFYGFDISKLPRDAWWRDRYAQLWAEAAAIVVLSRDMQGEIVRLGCPADRVHIVHLARRFEALAPRALGWPVRNLVSVGRLVEKKGHLHAVQAIHQVLRQFPEVRLEIIGEGPLQPEIERLVQTLGLSRQVSLLGALPSQETLRRMQRADAFLLCSHTGADGDKEGTPTVLVEAQRLGLPVVSTLHAGIPEMLPTENHCFLAPEGDVPAIADRLTSLMACTQDSLASIALRGRTFVEQHFDLAVTGAKLHRLYRLLLGDAFHDQEVHPRNN